MVTLGSKEISPIIDSLYAIGSTLDDEEVEQVLERLSRVTAESAGAMATSGHVRMMGQKNIVDAAGKRSIERRIIAGIKDSIALNLIYRSPRLQEALSLTVYPLFKLFYQRAWYLIVKDTNRREFHPCRFDRIEVVSAAPTFPRNADRFRDIQEARSLIGCGWGMTFPKSTTEAARIEKQPDIIVRFDRSVSKYLLEGASRHRHARVQKAKDGTGDVLFSIKLSDPWEFRHWVRSFGSLATIIAPDALVDNEYIEICKLKCSYESLLSRRASHSDKSSK